MKENPSVRVLFVGGGSGGHFYPLVAIAERLNSLANPPALYYAGPDAYDPEALKAVGMRFVRILSGKQRCYHSILNILDLFKLFFGLILAFIKLFFIYPDVIVSRGGYTSVPVLLAGAFFRIPIIIHESDAVMGKAHRIGIKFARHIVTTYEETEMPPTKAVLQRFGIPIRSALLKGPDHNAIEHLRIDPDRPVLLIMGGSQGAERINSLVLDSLDELLAEFTVIHQTGKKNFDVCTLSAKTLIPDEAVRIHYHPYPFLDQSTLNDAYHLSQIVISRAGSTSIYEIALHGKPSIIIPIPEDISHDQRTNAYAYARTGAASVIEEKNLSDGLLCSEINRIMQNEGLYSSMANAASAFGKADSAERIRDLVLKIAEEH
jgi:UDP-N-acetylglucosamine--N-acetylmuramyl-(pentapeptide) pyrophosphoryl-undecaprenol N-acetylglucosamine transferase